MPATPAGCAGRRNDVKALNALDDWVLICGSASTCGNSVHIVLVSSTLNENGIRYQMAHACASLQKADAYIQAHLSNYLELRTNPFFFVVIVYDALSILLRELGVVVGGRWSVVGLVVVVVVRGQTSKHLSCRV